MKDHRFVRSDGKELTMTGWKILTHDYRPPIQRGKPLFDGTYPFTLPGVDLDTSEDECARGWNFTRTLEGAIKIAGLWHTGYPNSMVAVEPSADWIERGDKCRASSLTLLRAATAEEIRSAILKFSSAFAPHTKAMAEEQWLWYQALGRPNWDREQVMAELRLALETRGLSWVLKEFPTARAARDAWDARDARAAWAARDAWDARAALIVEFTAHSGWIGYRHDLLTVGIRDAYTNGLAVALPTGPNKLGWAMEAKK
jgi:hypothetical protein